MRTLVCAVLLVTAQPSLAADQAPSRELLYALNQRHSGQQVTDVEVLAHYSVAQVHCGRYRIGAGPVLEFAFEQKRGIPGRLLDPARATCTALSTNPEELKRKELSGILDAHLADLDKKLAKTNDELLTLKIAQRKVQYSSDSNRRANDFCFGEYTRFKNMMLLEREQYGNSGYRKNFNMWVLDRKRRSGDIDLPCGYWLADKLGRHPEAFEFAEAEFYSRHMLHTAEHDNAEMLRLMFQTGRGGKKDPERAKFWEEKAKARKPR